MKKRKICIVTGTRAEYGLLSNLMSKVKDDSSLELLTFVTGSHLSPEFGLTFKAIEQDGFAINKKIEMVLSADTSSSIIKSTGLGMIGFADALKEAKPDLVILLGDRYEMLAASFASLISRIPICHIHGGESTEGSYDEQIRHSITKMSWWHFVATEEYRKRVIQLGENPERVFNVGGMGVDIINNTDLLSKKELQKEIGFEFSTKNILVTYHPVTMEKKTSKNQFYEILNALKELEDINLIFTMPNADSDGRGIIKMIESFVQNNPNRSTFFKSMGQLNYLSTMQYIDGVVGNSSSGLLEAPSFKIGTVNIGDRQKGRIRAKSIIDCEPNKNSIKSSIKLLFSEEFKSSIKDLSNPYGLGNATNLILEIIKNKTLPSEIKKSFYNL
tara:strand:- start:46842 stop:48002 length:1161 start_codon:yes stop_codon:yes gene_type:complete